MALLTYDSSFSLLFYMVDIVFSWTTSRGVFMVAAAAFLWRTLHGL